MLRRQTGLIAMVAAVVAVLAFVAWPRPVAAQCGSSVSSCKDCHEVKKQDPVNTKGEWHTAHAFGDFCEFCHAGNVKGTDKASAHTGLIDPLSDVKGSCQSCHPNDYEARAAKFATVLGKPIGSGTASAAAAPAAAAPVTAAAGACAPTAPSGGQLIDLNKVYASASLPQSGNTGNFILAGLIAATALVFGGLVWHYERPLPRGVAAFRQLLATPASPAAVGEEGEPLAGAFAGRPELASLLPLLNTADPETVRALAHLLADRENGPRVIKAAGHLDSRVLAALGEADPKALAALLALAKEMGS